MSADTFQELNRHYGHKVVVTRYAMAVGDPVNVAIECQDCSEVLLDYDREEDSDE